MQISVNTKITGVEKLVFFTSQTPQVKGIIAIHNTLRGPALGGCRIYDYNTVTDGVNDAMTLAKAMTYKNTIVDLPFGGGKAVIYKNPHVTQNLILEAFARVLNHLAGEYYTADDVGTSVTDMNYLRQYSPYARGILFKGKQIPATSYGVYQAIKAAVFYKEQTTSLSGLTVAVQGLGKVGYSLCKYLAKEGCKLYVYDPVKNLVDKAVIEFNATPIVMNNDTEVCADVFSPCALGMAINNENKHKLNVKYIIGGANNQLSDPEIAGYLHKKSILYVPDYLCNAGGVIDIYCEDGIYTEDKVLEKVSIIYNKTIEILTKADQLSQTPLEVANLYVKNKLKGSK
jgi:leucine dehydrogenase